jgi:hypothetical protein
MIEISSVGGSTLTQPRSTELCTSNPFKCYSVADRVLAFQGVDGPTLTLVHSFLSGYFFTPVETSPTQQPDHLIVIHNAEPPDFPVTDGFEIEDGYCYASDKQILLVVNESTILVGEPESNRTDVWLSDTTQGKHPLALNNVILYAVQSALRRAGLYQFHAACVLPPAQTIGVLVVGDSGCGKSTLTTTLVRNGWRFSTDDNLLLSDTESGIMAWALRRYFTFHESTLKACKLHEFDFAVGGRVDSDKLRFDARCAFPEGFVELCRPAVILFPEIGNESKSRIAPMEQSNALARLLEQCPWATCDVAAAPKHLKALSDLIRQTKSYSLSAARDIFDEPSSISDLLSQEIDV